MQQLLERPLSGFGICAVFLDGTCYRDQNLLVALGLTCEGYKIALGLRKVSTENAIVVKELLSGLTGHGLDFSVPRLYVVDGSKALSAACEPWRVESRSSSAARSTKFAMCCRTLVRTTGLRQEPPACRLRQCRAYGGPSHSGSAVP
jgi:hypothetical protein